MSARLRRTRRTGFDTFFNLGHPIPYGMLKIFKIEKQIIAQIFILNLSNPATKSTVLALKAREYTVLLLYIPFMPALPIVEVGVVRTA